MHRRLCVYVYTADRAIDITSLYTNTEGHVHLNIGWLCTYTNDSRRDQITDLFDRRDHSLPVYAGDRATWHVRGTLIHPRTTDSWLSHRLTTTNIVNTCNVAPLAECCYSDCQAIFLTCIGAEECVAMKVDSCSNQHAVCDPVRKNVQKLKLSVEVIEPFRPASICWRYYFLAVLVGDHLNMVFSSRVSTFYIARPSENWSQ